MCDPVTIAVGIGIGAATGGIGAAITGQDIGQGMLMGGIMGGLTAGFGGMGAGSMASTLGGNLGASTSTSFINAVGSSITQAGVLGYGVIGLGGSIAMGMLAPSKQGYTPIAQVAQQQQNMNTNIATTGSGGRQAAKSLATAISRTKKRKLTQDDVGDLSLSTESFTNTGLQLA